MTKVLNECIEALDYADKTLLVLSKSYNVSICLFEINNGFENNGKEKKNKEKLSYFPGVILIA